MPATLPRPSLPNSDAADESTTTESYQEIYLELRRLGERHAKGEMPEEQFRRELEELSKRISPDSPWREAFRSLFPSLKRSR